MFRGIATRIVHRRFVTIQTTPQPCDQKLSQNSIWLEKRLRHPSKVPQKCVACSVDSRITSKDITAIVLSEQTVRLLERLSLVDLDSKEAYRTLQDSIEFASTILHIDTDGVEPLYTVLEQRKLALRPDTVDDGYRQEEVLQNAVVTEEEYFIAPPGNIPLDQAHGVHGAEEKHGE